MTPCQFPSCLRKKNEHTEEHGVEGDGRNLWSESMEFFTLIVLNLFTHH